MNIFDEALGVLKSKVQVRKLFHDMHAEDLQRVIGRIEAIYEEKVMAQMEVEEEQARKKKRWMRWLKRLKSLVSPWVISKTCQKRKAAVAVKEKHASVICFATKPLMVHQWIGKGQQPGVFLRISQTILSEPVKIARPVSFLKSDG